ncbi:MAG: conjugal transfer protein TrbH [Pseudomonadota bacterium]
MRHFFLAALFGAALAGCATPPSPYGNFIPGAAEAQHRKIAADTVTQLLAVYPPASTRFDLQHVTPDVFGGALVEALRTRGYALHEFQPAPAALVTTSAPGLPLRYVLDQTADARLVRVTLLVGHQSLTRAYLAQNGSMMPAGAWVRKE